MHKTKGGQKSHCGGQMSHGVFYSQARHCVALVCLGPRCSYGLFFSCGVLVMPGIGPFQRAVSVTQAGNQATQSKSRGPKTAGWDGTGWAWALSTPLSGSGYNKSIDCPSPAGAKCKQIEKERGQNRLVTETDELNRGLCCR